MNISEGTAVSITTNKISELFDLLECPKVNNELVKYECGKLLGKIEIQKLASEFNIIGDLIRLAENSSVKQPKIHLKVIIKIISRNYHFQVYNVLSFVISS